MKLSPELLVAMFNVVAPIVRDIIANHKAANNGAMPTDAEIAATFAKNIDGYLAEGAAWRAAHPDA